MSVKHCKIFNAGETIMIKKTLYDMFKENNDNKDLSVYKDIIDIILKIAYDPIYIDGQWMDFILG